MARNRPTFSTSGFDKRAACTTISDYAKGQPIFSQGEVADAMYRVEHGNVKLSKKSEHGKNAVLAVLHAGESFGESCLDGTALRSSTATAVQNSRIARVGRRPMLRRLQQEPALAQLFISHLLLRVANSEDDHANQLLNSSERRLARILLKLTSFNNGGPRRSRRAIKIDQGTLAEMVGTTRSRVSYFMNQFRKKRFIDYNGTLHVHRALLTFLLRTPAHS
jgi:CRP/FNR family transcriptional regulator, cyclic AMP receptor protein